MNYHILNGDALKEQLSGKLKGSVIVLRECFMEGPVNGESDEEFFENRALFFADHFDQTSYEDYFENTVPELTNLSSIPSESTVNLWFEDDLFCQVNMWYAFHMLTAHAQPKFYFLIRPMNYTPYSFGKMDKMELCHVYSHKTAISNEEARDMALLWELFKDKCFDEMLEIATKNQAKLPFLKPAVEAHIARFEGETGRPEAILMEILEKNEDAPFGEIFRKFNKKAAIYGFGDLQVKKMMDQLRLEH